MATHKGPDSCCSTGLQAAHSTALGPQPCLQHALGRPSAFDATHSIPERVKGVHSVAGNGALRVLKGSHRQPRGMAEPGWHNSGQIMPSQVVPSQVQPKAGQDLPVRAGTAVRLPSPDMQTKPLTAWLWSACPHIVANPQRMRWVLKGCDWPRSEPLSACMSCRKRRP